jgi:hypothetical protein
MVKFYLNQLESKAPKGAFYETQLDALIVAVQISSVLFAKLFTERFGNI